MGSFSEARAIHINMEQLIVHSINHVRWRFGGKRLFNKIINKKSATISRKELDNRPIKAIRTGVMATLNVVRSSLRHGSASLHSRDQRQRTWAAASRLTSLIGLENGLNVGTSWSQLFYPFVFGLSK